jgi:predicted outer membrane protein
MLRACSMLALATVAAVALGQAQVPPTTPRTPNPAQDSLQPGGQPGAQPGIAQPDQPGSPSQLQPGQPGGQPRTANFRGEPGSASQTIDGQLAACLVLGNEGEVALSRLANERASSDQVKKFAQQMIDVHTKAAQQLRQFAPQDVSLQLSSSGGNPAARGVEVRAETSAGVAGSGAEANIGRKMLTIEREAKQQCLEMAEKELGEKRGSEFDECYIGQQIGGHLQMIAAMTVFERHVSPDLQRVISDQRKTAEQHLAHAKQIARDVKSSPSAAGDRGISQPSTAQQPGGVQR